MVKRRVHLTHRGQRSVLTDMLPFEVPPTFSNRGFYKFLRDNNVEIEAGHLRWTHPSDALDVCIKILFGVPRNESVSVEVVTEWGKTKSRRSVLLKKCQMDTIPFNFKVSHNLDGRTLSVVHPRNQLEVASFYAHHSALILYYASISEFSIRRPASVSRYVYFDDKLHQERLETIHSGAEEEGREYEQLGSYFVYKAYRNIHRFFESHQYHRAEKKYDAMIQVDVSKCFDSIYTHSLAWALIGKAQIKFALDESKTTFAGKFDSVMQNLNHKETNGIVIGPEFSRVFAELILQSIDRELEEKLRRAAKLDHRVHYEIFRYVDDYFIFYNQESTHLRVVETLQDILKTKKLSINSAKIKQYNKPIITEITIAKERISNVLNEDIKPEVEVEAGSDGSKPDRLRLVVGVNSNRLIVRYKAAIKESKVEYGDLLNYTFAIVERKIEKLLSCYLETDKAEQDRRRTVRALLAILEFSFFIYSASPKVNHTVRLCRMLSTAIDFLNSNLFPYDLKHLLFKLANDNIMQQIDKNTMTPHRETESLYLLIALSHIGRQHWLPEAVLAKHFLITKRDGVYFREEHLNAFAITVLLSYIRDKLRYTDLRTFLENHVIEKFNFIKAHCPNDTEALILFLDLVVCPYISLSTKEALAASFDLTTAELASIQEASSRWFTAWGDKFDLSKELDAKRSREVY